MLNMMSQRSCVRFLYVLLLSLTVFMSIGLADIKEKKPNIIYILVDDLGYGDLSCYGQKKFKTPNIDRLATEGLKFSQHYSGSTVCAPSRCSLMTGLNTGHAQVRGNFEVQPEGQAPMKEGTITIPTLLKKAGYVSGAFGKWGLGAPGSVSDPTVFFDEFYGYNCQRQAHSFYPTHLWHNKKKVMLNRKAYSHDLILKHALEFVTKNKENSFFCYLAISIPHAAMEAPKHLHDKYRKLYPQFEKKKGYYSRGTSVVQNPVAAFPAMMEHMDNGIGELLALLKKLNIDEDTLVMFTSDNGAHREGGHDPKFWDSNGPLKGLKRDLYEGGIRTPLLARWPGKIEAGRVSHHISAFWDMMPTFCEMAGVAPTKDTDGISMLPEILGKKQTPHQYLYWEFPRRGGLQAIRRGKFKAIRKNLGKNPNSPIELYNVEDDLGETKNIAAKYPEVIQEMKKLFKTSRFESEKFPLFNQ